MPPAVPAIMCLPGPDVPEPRGQQPRYPAARPRRTPLVGLYRGFLHDRVVVIGPVPAGALVIERARATRRLSPGLAGGTPTRAERHQRPPQQEDLILAHLGHQHHHRPGQAGTVGGISADQAGPSAFSPPYSGRRRTAWPRTGLWHNRRARGDGAHPGIAAGKRPADGPWPPSREVSMLSALPRAVAGMVPRPAR